MKLPLDNNLAVKYPEIAKEWSEKNTLTAYEITPGSHKKGLWRCSNCGHEWEASPNDRVRGRNNCLVCRSLAAKFPEIAKEWSKKNTLTAYEITPGSHKKGLWRCSKCCHEWETSPVHRVYNNHNCLVCRSLAAKFPEIAKEWSEKNTLTAYEITPGSDKKGLWHCSKCSHEWETSPAPRTSSNKTGCPACDNKVVTSTNNLAVKFPEIAKEWSEKNTLTASEVMPGSRKKYFWECSKCGYSWEASPGSRTSNGSGCPKCSAGKAEKKFGEILESILKNLEITDYCIQGQHQVKIKGSRHYYDYSIKKDNSVVGLFEYDGHQHFNTVRWTYHISEEQAQANFEAYKNRDKEKDKYAKDQGIPLIRTHYKEMEDFDKQIKQGISEIDTDLYRRLENEICPILN